MSYKFKSTEIFWECFYNLPSNQKESARRVWKIFKVDPFDSRLRTHKNYGKTIYAVEVERDLRCVFYIEADVVVTVDIGSHDVYKR